MDKPLISVIVPIYNVEKYLDRCVQSIVDQTYKELEIILVDDGSPDNSPEICDEWAKKDGRIKVIHKKNGGVSSARNAGLDAARGEYIGFVDGDDYLSPEMYDALYSLIADFGADAAACAIVRESANGYIEDWSDGTLREFNNLELLQWIGAAEGLLPVHLGNKLFSSAVTKNIRFQKFKYAEDVLFNFQVAKSINKLVLKSEPFYHYFNNSDSVSHIKFDKSRFDEHKVMDIIFSQVKQEPEILKYCVMGDVFKSFRTIKEMCESGNCLEYFSDIRSRILNHKKEIFTSGLYSKSIKLKTAFLWFFPVLYKIFIGRYAKMRNKQYKHLTEA